QRPKTGKFDYLSEPNHPAHSMAFKFFTDDNLMREGYPLASVPRGGWTGSHPRTSRGRASVRRRAINLRSVNPSHNGSDEQILGAKEQVPHGDGSDQKRRSPTDVTLDGGTGSRQRRRSWPAMHMIERDLGSAYVCRPGNCPPKENWGVRRGRDEWREQAHRLALLAPKAEPVQPKPEPAQIEQPSRLCRGDGCGRPGALRERACCSPYRPCP